MKNVINIILFILILIRFSYAQYGSINVGILPFSDPVVSELSGELSKYKFIKLVERSKLKEILKEFEMGMTGMVDEKTVSKAGTLHGIQIMITGSAGKNKISARAIHTESAKVIASASTSGRLKLQQLCRKLASGIEMFLARENLKTLRNDSPELKLDFWLKRKDNRSISPGKKGDMKIGESVVFFFKADTGGYLTIVDIQPDGNVVILFPNEMSPDNKIRGNRVYAIPSKNDEYEITVSKPAGTDTVVAFFTKKRVGWLDRKKLMGKGFWIVRDYERYNLTRGFKITTTKLKKSDWESKTLEIDVVE